MATISAMIGTYSAKWACARMALRSSILPPSLKAVRVFSRSRTTCTDRAANSNASTAR
jgi:hypothetical protein